MKNIKTILLAIFYMTALVSIGIMLTALTPPDPVKAMYEGEALDSPLTSLTASTSLSGSDVFYVVVSGNSRKVSWSSLMSIIRDSIEANNWPTTGSWEFIGGEFNSGSRGTVNFYDTVMVNATGGVFIIEGGAKQLVYGEMNFVTGGTFLVAPKTTITTYRHLGYIGADGSGQLTFNYGSSLTDTIPSKRSLRTDDLYFGGIVGNSCDSIALTAGGAGLNVSANVLVLDGNATPSSVSLSAPTYNGQMLTILCAASDTHGFSLLDTDNQVELIGDANKTFGAGDVMLLTGYNGIWYQAAALAAN